MATSEDPVPPPMIRLSEIPGTAWITAGLIALALALFVNAVFPRYEYTMIDNGRSMMVYDRWANQFQRVNYDEQGSQASLSDVVVPF
jgi:hypothetical protein